VFHCGRKVQGCGYALLVVLASPTSFSIRVTDPRGAFAYTEDVARSTAQALATGASGGGSVSDDVELARLLCSQLAIVDNRVAFDSA
jgi:hypothetical protein